MSEQTGSNETNPLPIPGQGEQTGEQQPQGIARPEVVGQEQQPKQDAFVTRAELDAAMLKIVAQSQSAVGKMEGRIEKKLTELKSFGIQATPEQAQKMVEAEAAQEGSLQGQSQTPAAAAQPQPKSETSSDPLTALAIQWAKEDGLPSPDPLNLKGYRIMAEAGVRLKDGDPELSLIDPSAAPEVWESQVKAAVDKAKERIANAGNPARMPAAASGQPLGQPAHAGKSGSQTLNDYFDGLHL